MVELEDISARSKSPSNLSRPRKPAAPGLTRESVREDEEQENRRRAQEHVERTRIVRGLILLAVLILLLSMQRAGWGRVFVPGWWRQW